MILKLPRPEQTCFRHVGARDCNRNKVRNEEGRRTWAARTGWTDVGRLWGSTPGRTPGREPGREPGRDTPGMPPGMMPPPEWLSTGGIPPGSTRGMPPPDNTVETPPPDSIVGTPPPDSTVDAPPDRTVGTPPGRAPGRTAPPPTSCACAARCWWWSAAEASASACIGNETIGPAGMGRALNGGACPNTLCSHRHARLPVHRSVSRHSTCCLQLNKLTRHLCICISELAMRGSSEPIARHAFRNNFLSITTSRVWTSPAALIGKGHVSC